jgi:hypothetical protein
MIPPMPDEHYICGPVRRGLGITAVVGRGAEALAL